MAEYKNGVNVFGNVSVSKEDISAEVQTGRVVIVDQDRYESDSAYKAKVDKCVEEGFMRSDSAGSSGGSSSGGGGVALPAVKYAVNAHVTSITCDTPFEDVMNFVHNGIPFVLFCYYDGDVTDVVVFPPQITSITDEVFFTVSINGVSVRVRHTAESITMEPLSE